MHDFSDNTAKNGLTWRKNKYIIKVQPKWGAAKTDKEEKNMKIKRFIAVFLAAAIAAVSFALPANAVSTMSSATQIVSKITYNGTLANGDSVYYKVVLNEPSNIYVSVTADMTNAKLYLYDSNAEAMPAQSWNCASTCNMVYSSYKEITLYRMNSSYKLSGNVNYASASGGGLPAGTYYIFIKNYSGGGTGSYSVTAKFNNRPVGLTATAGANSVTLKWNWLAGATQYRVQRYANEKWVTIAYPTAESYTNKGLSAGTKYTYRVLGLVAGEWTDASASASATPYAASSTVPTGLTAAGGNRSVTLSWNKVTGASEYRIQRYTGGIWKTIGFTSSTIFAENGLTNGTSYQYRVLSQVNGVWSKASAVITAKPNGVSAPATVTATGGTNSVTVKWSAVSGANQYRIQRYISGKWSTVGTTASTSFVNKGLAANTSYTYRVIAGKSNVWGEASKTVSAKTAAAVTAPANVKGYAGANSATISWSKVANATQYRVQRYTSAGWTTVTFTSSLTYTNNGLQNGVTYRYRVLANVGGIWSPASAVVSVTPTSTIPSNLTAISGNKQITLRWNGVSGATQYRIQRSYDTAWTTITTVNTTSYVDKNLSNGTVYKYRVMAYVNGVWSAASNVVATYPQA